jgi:hypothetical protein
MKVMVESIEYPVQSNAPAIVVVDGQCSDEVNRTPGGWRFARRPDDIDRWEQENGFSPPVS